MAEKYSITRALTLLKTLQDRYESTLSTLHPTTIMVGTTLKRYTSYKVEDFVSAAVSTNQSVEALYKRIIEIKNSIDAVNMVTKVKIGSREMTIQQALVEKKYLFLKENLLRNYKTELEISRRDYETAVRERESRIDSMLNLSSDRSSQQISTKDDNKNLAEIRAIYEDTEEKKHPIKVVDPLNLEERIKTLSEEIEEFKTNIDYVLSEINATTFIEIGD